MADERTEKQKVKEITNKLEQGLKELLSGADGYTDFEQALTTVSPVPIGFEDIPGDSKGYFHMGEKRIAIQENIKLEGDNPTIGIVLCSEKMKRWLSILY